MLPIACSSSASASTPSLTRVHRLWAAAAALLIALIAPTAANAQLSVSHGRDAVPEGSTYDFGEVRQGRTFSRNFVVRNLGSESVTLGTPVITGTGYTARVSKVFLRPNKKTRILVRIDSTVPGVQAATIHIPIVGSAETPFSFDVTGEVIGPEPRARVSGSGGVLFSGDPVFFGSSRTGESQLQNITIQNTGQLPLTISDFSLTGSGFELISAPAATVNRGKKTRIRIRMNTETSGSPEGTVRFTTNDPDATEFTLMLSGSVQADGPNIQLIGLGAFIDNGETVDFGSLDEGGVRIERFIVRNRGTEDLVLGEAMSSDPAFIVSVQPTSVLEPFTSTSMFVTYQSSLGSATATISIPTNDTDDSPFVFSATGVGEPAPDIQVFRGDDEVMQGVQVLFGAGFPDNFLSDTFTIRNRGSETLTIASVGVTGAYMIDPDVGDDTLEPGEETTFGVTIMLSDPVHLNTLSINSNDPNDSPFEFSLQSVTFDDGVNPSRPSASSQDDAIMVEVDGEPVGASHAIEFGVAYPGAPVERFFTITNSGFAPLRIGGLQIHGAGFRVGDQPSAVLAPGAETSFSIILSDGPAGKAAAVVRLPIGRGDEVFTFLIHGLIARD